MKLSFHHTDDIVESAGKFEKAGWHLPTEQSQPVLVSQNTFTIEPGGQDDGHFLSEISQNTLVFCSVSRLHHQQCNVRMIVEKKQTATAKAAFIKKACYLTRHLKWSTRFCMALMFSCSLKSSLTLILQFPIWSKLWDKVERDIFKVDPALQFVWTSRFCQNFQVSPAGHLINWSPG